MAFVLRELGDTSNPTLARVYGPSQSTAGKVALFDRDGDQTTFILFLAQGGKYGCDGIDEFHYNGTDVPESGNWKFHPGTRSLGYDDPAQGRPTYFPTLETTFSGICYVEGRLPAALSPGVGIKPDGFEIFMRGLKVMHYNLVDGLLQETSAAVSANNAWVGLDILREVGGMPLSRFQPFAQSWIDYRDRCDALINWDKGPDHGGVVQIPRYEANVVFSSSIGWVSAFQTVIDRSPGVMWQDVNKGIRILPNPDRDPVHTFSSLNVQRKGISLTPPDPNSLYNYFLYLFRDIDDVDSTTGQLLYRQRKAEVDLPSLRDANQGRLRKLGPIDLGGGPMHQSLAERIAWYQARQLTALNAVRDMTEEPIHPKLFEIKAPMSSFKVAKNDYIEIADHYMVNSTPLCKVNKEIIHGKRGERTFSVQTWARDIYRDTDHSQIQTY